MSAESDTPNARLINSFGRELLWMRPSLFKREHRLVAGRDLLAYVRWHRFHSGTATTASGTWEIEPSGIFGVGGRITNKLSGEPVLTIKGFIRSGTFQTPDGHIFNWRRRGLLRLALTVSNNSGQELLTCAHTWANLRRAGQLIIESAGATHRLLDPLVLAAWYVVYRLRKKGQGAHG